MTRKAAIKTLYDHPSDMEPLLPGEGASKMSALALALIRGAERLRATLHPITRKLVTDLVRSMNSYYSNLIEGHRTRPGDIDAAIRKDFSTNPAQRSLQMQHLAHMEVQAEMEARLPAMAAGEVCSTEFLCWLHEGFSRRLPEEFRKVEDEKGKTHEVQPGKLRQSEVSVLREIFIRGELARGEVSRIIGASPRTAQKVTGELLTQRLVTTGSPKGPLRLGFPADAAGYYFPNLYPAGAD